MAYKRDTVEDAMVSHAKGITTTAGYENNIASTSVFRRVRRPIPEDLKQEISGVPLIYVLGGDPATPLYQKGMVLWTIRPRIFCLIAANIATESTVLNSWIGDVTRLTGKQPTWGSTAIDTRITSVELVEFERPHAAFEIPLEVTYEHALDAP